MRKYLKGLLHHLTPSADSAAQSLRPDTYHHMLFLSHLSDGRPQPVRAR
jgi:hypothetical protein